MVVFGALSIAPHRAIARDRCRAVLKQAMFNKALSSVSTQEPAASGSLRSDSSSDFLESLPHDCCVDDAHSVACDSCGGRHLKGAVVERDFEVQGTVLGTGMSGNVVLGQRHHDAARRAVKRYHKPSLSLQELADLRRETDIYLSLDHPHIARLECVYESDTDTSFVMECLEGGEVFDRVVQRGRYTEIEAADALKQMLLAFEYLHGEGIVHLDVKAENFVYETKADNGIKLIDFGLARRMAEPKGREVCGTQHYMAPEVCNRTYTTSQPDMWSLGVLAYVLLCGTTPWVADEAKTLQMIKAGSPRYSRNLFDPLSLHAKDFVRKLLCSDELRRSTAAVALKHPWLCPSQFPMVTCDQQIVSSFRSFAATSPVSRKLALMAAWSLPAASQVMLRHQYVAASSNRRGTISLQEFRSALLSAGVAGAELHLIFACANQSGDGSMSYSEFLAAASFSDSQPSETIESSFRQFDVSPCS